MNLLFRTAPALIAFAAVCALPAQPLTLQDGVPVRLRLMQTVSSAEAHEGDTVDFEVTEPVVLQDLVVIPKGSVALGKVIATKSRRRFGRSGELEINIDSVRLADGSRTHLRASKEKGTEAMGSGRLAATIATSPVLVWVRGKDVVFQKGMETTAYVDGDAHLDAAQLKGQTAPSMSPTPSAAPIVETSADRSAPAGRKLTNSDVIEMQKSGLSEDVILTKIRNSSTDFRTSPHDLIELKDAGVSDSVITLIVQKSGQR